MKSITAQSKSTWWHSIQTGALEWWNQTGQKHRQKWGVWVPLIVVMNSW